MKNNLTIIITFIISIFSIYSQESKGHWDYERAIEKKIPLADGDKTLVTVNIPTGTTQLIYRVTFQSNSEELRSSLSRTLQSIESPKTQGAAAAINLLEKFGGDNKGSFHIFQSINDGENYIRTLIPKNACYNSEKDIPGEKNYMVLDQGQCLNSNTKNLIFSFFNNNDFDDVTIILELMPWIDNEASKGWTKEVKENFINNCIELEEIEDFSNPEKFCQCLLDKYQENLTVQDFTKLTSSEINKISEEYSIDCYKETGEANNMIEIERENATELIEQEEYGDAISKLKEIIENETPTLSDYNQIGWCYILTKQYLKAVKYLKDGEQIDETDLTLKGNLAHALLLSGEIENAKSIYIKYKNQNIDETTTWIDMISSDFNVFKTKGILSDQYDIIISLLK
jgi:tetratricopeptide (TPR) repeat protein